MTSRLHPHLDVIIATFWIGSSEYTLELVESMSSPNVNDVGMDQAILDRIKDLEKQLVSQKV